MCGSLLTQHTITQTALTETEVAAQEEFNV